MGKSEQLKMLKGITESIKGRLGCREMIKLTQGNHESVGEGDRGKTLGIP